MKSQLSTKIHSNQLGWIALAGLAFASAAFICSLLLVRMATGDWRIMIYTATLAAFFSGAFFWWLLLARSNRVTLWRGLSAGLLTGLVAHPLAWYFAILYFYVSGARNSLGEAIVNPLVGVWASLVFSLLSWLFFGWLTGPAGALVGGIVAYLQMRVAHHGSMGSGSAPG